MSVNKGLYPFKKSPVSYSAVLMQHYLFVSILYWWTFGLFPIFSITNSASINILIHSYLCTYASNLGNKTLEMELLGQMVYVFRILMNNPKITSKMFAPIYTPSNNV